MERRITLLIPARATAQVRKPEGGPGFFHWLYVEPNYRRRGYGIELMRFAIHYMKEYLQMDIRNRAKSCQRNAGRLGYKRTGRTSDRYLGCELWTKKGNRSHLPVSQLRLLNVVQYRRKNGQTEVLYLSDPIKLIDDA
jgi:GNAT superfamily N-acetyltransferase